MFEKGPLNPQKQCTACTCALICGHAWMKAQIMLALCQHLMEMIVSDTQNGTRGHAKLVSSNV